MRSSKHAFPLIADLNRELIGGEGLTKREYFAAAALQGLLAGGAGPASAPDLAARCADVTLIRLDGTADPGQIVDEVRTAIRKLAAEIEENTRGDGCDWAETLEACADDLDTYSEGLSDD